MYFISNTCGVLHSETRVGIIVKIGHADQIAAIYQVKKATTATHTPVVTRNTASEFPAGAWVRVRGRLKAGHFEADFMPIVHASQIEIVEEPDQAYLYP